MLEENELQLVITEKSLGSLTTNAKSIKELITKALPTYNAANYNEGTLDKAKEDRAILNKTSKMLNDERIKIEKEFVQPFAEFKDIVKETCDMIKSASDSIDGIIKEVEEKEKTKRKEIIYTLYNDNVKELQEILTIESIFDEKWLNKGSFDDNGNFKLLDELINKIDKVRKDLITIGSLKSQYEVELKNTYLSNFDLGEIINKNNELNEKAELLKSQQTESEKVVEEIKEENMQQMANEVIKGKVVDEIFTYQLEITGKESQLEALKKFMITNNMKWKNLNEEEK